MSDGAIYAGVGKTMNFGWQREKIIEYAERLYDCLLYTSCSFLFYFSKKSVKIVDFGIVPGILKL